MIPQKILFICLGNICRSPTFESVFRKRAAADQLKIEFDSAGTAAYHIGEGSDSRSRSHAENRGYAMTHRARQLTAKDFQLFDLLVVMDDSNYHNALKLCPTNAQYKLLKAKELFSQSKLNKVPDPYYGQAHDFEKVIDLAEECYESFKKIYLSN